MPPSSSPPPKRHKKPASTPASMTFDEILSVAGLQFLTKMDVTKFRSYFNDAQVTQDPDDEQTVREQYELVHAYATDALTHTPVEYNGHQVVIIPREYRPSETSPLGRLFVEGESRSGLALQRVWGPMRGCCLRPISYDFDMQNCHPSIVLSLCKEIWPVEVDEATGYPIMPWWHPIDAYIANRDTVRNTLSDLGVADPKKEVLRSLNKEFPIETSTCGVTIPKKAGAAFIELDKTHKLFHQKMWDLPQFKQFREGLANVRNKRGKFINRVLCYVENQLLMEAVEAVGREVVIAPMFDGMLCRNTIDPEKTLEALNALPGSVARGIKWTQKEHDNTVVVEEGYQGRESFVAATDTALAKTVVEELHRQDRLACCKGAVWFLGKEREPGDCRFRETVVAIAGDVRAREIVADRLYNELQDTELAYGDDMTMVQEQISSLQAFCNACVRQAVVDNAFETEYWASEPNDTYSRAIEKVNRFVVHLRDKSVFLCVQKDGTIEELTQNEIRANMKCVVGISFETWLASMKHNHVARDVFVPTLAPHCQPKDEFNLFQGLDIPYERCKDADLAHCQPLLHHIRDVLADGNEIVGNSILKTWARTLQGVQYGKLHWIKSNVCMLFLSRPGAGKGAVTRHMRTIIGPKYSAQLSKKNQLFGDFNDNAGRAKLWIEMDELLWAGNHQEANNFKCLITEDTVVVNAKFKKERAYASYHNYVACTNSDWAAQVDRDDRRFMAMNCNDAYAGPQTDETRAYFDLLHDPRASEPLISMAFAKFLYEYPVENFVPALALVDTVGRQQQKIQSLSATEQMIVSWLERGYIIDTCNFDLTAADPLCHRNKQVISTNTLFNICHTEFRTVRGFPDSMLKFAQSIHKILGGMIDTKYVGKCKENCKSFASLDDCRAHMNKYLGFKHFDEPTEPYDPSSWWVIR